MVCLQQELLYAIHPPYIQNTDLPYINNFLYLPLFLNLNNDGESRFDKVKLIKSVPNESQSTIKVLGVLLDNKLNFASHITNIHGKISRSLYSLRQTKNLLGLSSLKLVYAAHVHSHLNYISFILSAALKKHVEPLASVQRKAIRIVDGAGYRELAPPIFAKLNIMPLNFLIDYNACLFMYDYNYGHMSEGFTGMWIRRRDLYVGDDARELRNGDDWHVPILKYQYLAKHPLFYFPSTWNNLPNELKLVEPRKRFIIELRSYFMNLVYDPG